jgi:hypothetical protein
MEGETIHMSENTEAMPAAAAPPLAGPPLTVPLTQQAPGAAVRRTPYSPAKRACYGLLWAAWTAVLVIGGFAALFGGQILAGLLGIALGLLAGRYDYRIWTYQARRLLFLIIW